MSFNSNLFKTVIIAVCFLGVVAFWLPMWLCETTKGWILFDCGAFKIIGLLPFLLGANLIFWCVKDFINTGKGTPAPFAPPSQLVVSGLYRYSRNPMYAGLFLVLVGEAILCCSVFVLLYALVAIFAAHFFVIRYEEPELKLKFTDQYSDYLASVPRWRPKRPDTKN